MPLLVSVLTSLGATMAAEATSRHVRHAAAAECDWRRVTLLGATAYVDSARCAVQASAGR